MDFADGDSQLDDIAVSLTKILQEDLSNGDTILDDIAPESKYVNELANQIAKKATHTGENNAIVLGKWAEDSSCYIEQAKLNNCGYYSIPQKVWDQLKTKYGDNFMWLCNQRYLEQQYKNGVTFYFSHNPITEGGALANEYNFLVNSLGYNPYLWYNTQQQLYYLIK